MQSSGSVGVQATEPATASRTRPPVWPDQKSATGPPTASTSCRRVASAAGAEVSAATTVTSSVPSADGAAGTETTVLDTTACAGSTSPAAGAGSLTAAPTVTRSVAPAGTPGTSSVGTRTGFPDAGCTQLRGSAASGVRSSADSGHAWTSRPTTVRPASGSAAACAGAATATGRTTAAAATARAARRRAVRAAGIPSGIGGRGPPTGTSRGGTPVTPVAGTARAPPGTALEGVLAAHQPPAGLGDRARQRRVDREGVRQVARPSAPWCTARAIGRISSEAPGATTTPPTITPVDRPANSLTKPSRRSLILARALVASGSRTTSTSAPSPDSVFSCDADGGDLRVGEHVGRDGLELDRRHRLAEGVPHRDPALHGGDRGELEHAR